jgi:hypothetical protein
MLEHSFNLARAQYRGILASDASNTKIRFRLANLCAARVDEVPAGSTEAREMALEAIESFDNVLSSLSAVSSTGSPASTGGPGGYVAAAMQGKTAMELRLGVVSGAKKLCR